MNSLQVWLTLLVPLALMIILIIKKVPPILFMFVAALAAALLSGIPLPTAASQIVTSFGTLLQSAGLVLVFGSVFAEFLSKSGGIISLANALVKKTGGQGSVVAMYILGYVLCIPVNIIPAAAMMSPLIRKVSDQTGVARPAYACAFAVPAYLTTCTIVPTLTATVLCTISGVDVGYFLIWGFIITIPASIVGVLLYALFLAKKYGKVQTKAEFEAEGNVIEESSEKLPPVGTVLGLILVPICLIMVASLVTNMAPGAVLLNNILGFVGNPSIALFIGVVLEMVFLRKYLKDGIMNTFNSGVVSSGSTLVVVGVSAGLGTILANCGFGELISGYVSNLAIPLVLLVWIFASLFHMGIGTYLVVCTTLYPLLLPAFTAAGLSPMILVLTLATASVGFLIPTDSGFWIFKEGMGLTTKETFISITIPGIITSAASLIIILILSGFANVLPGLH